MPGYSTRRLCPPRVENADLDAGSELAVEVDLAGPRTALRDDRAGGVDGHVSSAIIGDDHIRLACRTSTAAPGAPSGQQLLVWVLRAKGPAQRSLSLPDSPRAFDFQTPIANFLRIDPSLRISTLDLRGFVICILVLAESSSRSPVPMCHSTPVFTFS